MRQLLAVTTLLGVAVIALPAQAQSFPPDSEWEPFLCGAVPMNDGYRDEPSALGPRDLVGDSGAPAGYRAYDDDFLYLRMRVDADPTQGTAFQPFAWGVEIDLDEDLQTYELLMLVDGGSDTVNLHTNTETITRNDPTDPADQPAVASYDVRTHAASKVLGGSSYGDDDDFAVDMAIAWADLNPLGLDETTPITAWVGTSSNAMALDGDLACHDGGDGNPSLTNAASDATTTDPATDSDGDGFTDEEELRAGTDPNDPNSTPGAVAGEGQLEGGGGCRAASEGRGRLGWVGLLMLSALLLAPRRRRRQ